MLTPTDVVSKAMRERSWVEVVCGLPHNSIYIPTQGWKCRYARGHVVHRESDLIIKSHDCHLCDGYWLMKANSPKTKRRCNNCGGPVVPSGESSCWPDLLMVSDFID